MEMDGRMGGGGTAVAATALVVVNRKQKERMTAVSYVRWCKSVVHRIEYEKKIIFSISVCVRWTRYHSSVQIPVARSRGD
jgi:hypothetical protein